MLEGMGTYAELVTALTVGDLESGCVSRFIDLAANADSAIGTWEKIISLTVGLTAQLP